MSDVFQLTNAHDEVSQLKDKCSEYKEEIGQLKVDLTDMSEEFQVLSYRTKTVRTDADHFTHKQTLSNQPCFNRLVPYHPIIILHNFVVHCLVPLSSYYHRFTQFISPSSGPLLSSYHHFTQFFSPSTGPLSSYYNYTQFCSPSSGPLSSYWFIQFCSPSSGPLSSFDHRFTQFCSQLSGPLSSSYCFRQFSSHRTSYILGYTLINIVGIFESHQSHLCMCAHLPRAYIYVCASISRAEQICTFTQERVYNEWIKI